MSGRTDFAALVVDDDEMMRSLIARLLMELGLPTVLQARSATDALELLARHRPAWVLTDWSMETPHAGLEVVRYAERHRLCVVVVSGQAPSMPEGERPVRWIPKIELSLERLGQELGLSARE